MTQAKRKILVAMSGGVDSSVAAALLLRDGHEVIGAFMKNWSEDEDACTGDCGWKRERADALRVAAKLGIKFETLDFEAEYKAAVVDYMVREYAAGRTPNPDVMCNRDIKFGPFLKAAERLGCDAIATGHYARIGSVEREAGSVKSNANENSPLQTSRFTLLAGLDPNKDQSYFLHRLNQDQLSRTLFPVGHLLKPEVRRLAAEFGLPTADKKDSQGICFIGKVDLAGFLRDRLPPQSSGFIVTVKGEVIGKHDGLAHFTVGQRHGLGVGGGAPLYVVRKDLAANTLIVTDDRNDVALQTSRLLGDEVHWISGAAPDLPFRCQARIRYRQPLQSAAVAADPGRPAGIAVVFDVPQRAVSPGQFCVFYDGDECLGGATIAAAGAV